MFHRSYPQVKWFEKSLYTITDYIDEIVYKSVLKIITTKDGILLSFRIVFFIMDNS